MFLRLYRARDSYRPQARFTTFLYRIARNLWIDRYRSRKSAPGETSLDAPSGREGGKEMVLRDRIPAAVRDPADEAGGRELAESLREAVGRLPEEHRQVFVLGQYRGLPYADISEILSIPEGTVKSRMHAAVRRLRGFLGGLDELAG